MIYRATRHAEGESSLSAPPKDATQRRRAGAWKGARLP